jgi:hypothetical protein
LDARNPESSRAIIEKIDIFHYVYAVLHDPVYRGKPKPSSKPCAPHRVDVVSPHATAPRCNAPNGDRGNIMDGLKAGERVAHPMFGLGTVLSDEITGRVEIQFDANGRKLLALKYALLRRVNLLEEAEFRAAAAASMEETFEFETTGGSHAPGSHWPPFYASFLDEIVSKFDTIMPQCSPALGVSSFDTYRAPALPDYWPKAFKLRWPAIQSAIHFAVKQLDGQNRMTAMFPVMGTGTQATVTITKVHVLESSVEAQVEAKIGAASVTFYDTDFVINAGWYRANTEMDFILCGLAYQCEPANEPDMVLAEDSPAMQNLRKAALEVSDDPAQVADRISFKGAAVLLPIEGWDRDDYQFRGTIKEVKPFPMLGQDGWLVTVCVMRYLDESDRELDLRILVTPLVWKESRPPRVGEDVRGALWLQGYLWSPPARTERSFATGQQQGGAN